VGLFGRVVVTFLPIMPRFIVRFISKRYVAGPDLESAISCMKKLSSEGACFTVDVLGEEITTLDEANEFLEEYERLLDAIIDHGLDANLSIKPTAFGLLIDEKTALANIERLLKRAAEHNIFVRLDMEDYRVTDATIDVVLKMHDAGFTNIGTVLQARLFRTMDDVDMICDALGPDADFRLCKGIYLESAEIAHTGYQDIVDAMNRCCDKILERGAYFALASHDKPVIAHAEAALVAAGVEPSGDGRANALSAQSERVGKGWGHEFQMLLGVRGDIRRRLAGEGHRTRVYIPYGKRWYEYSMRRLRENPDIAWHVTKAMLLPWTNRR
jgi:proline dehydrogenase